MQQWLEKRLGRATLARGCACIKKGETRADVHDRLKSVFQDSPVDIWDCRLVW